ncbi:MAG: class I SAM-dependent methyltransferase [Myxococcota bacterium]
MTHRPSDWSAERGARWAKHLAGIDALLAPVDEPLIDALTLDGPVRIADIGCGGGATASTLARRAAAGSRVFGYDLAPASISEAKRRAAAEELSIDFKVCDVAVAPVDVPFDRLVSRFGVMFFDDAPDAFTNLYRWLVPGGRFAFAVWDALAANPWMVSVREAVERVAPLDPPESDSPGPFRYAEVEQLVALLEGSGFQSVSAMRWRGELPIGDSLSSSEAARFALSAFATFADALERAGPHAFGAAQDALSQRFAMHEREGSVWMDASVHIITGGRGLETDLMPSV